ncbi:MAG: Cytidine and deoxycytidylate deaminase zinc-binding region [Polyangiaceae bacterium]|jgi:tRNA(Arg) A34 adenosine deaminase TadA|nr:Cytidine and deoxycytidylate deaminase zinc-binding region [Polyangiaceae bacterium]
MQIPKRVQFELPEWLFSECDLQSPRADDTARMQLAIELSRRNVAHGGGPFGAVVFERETGEVIAPGMNLVMPQNSSLLHAEVVAVMFAQTRLQTYTLANGNYELVTSSEPCVQCLGACHWAGLSRLVCGAPMALAESAGFDEGPRSEDWKEQLAARGTPVVTGVCASEAGDVLLRYAAEGGFRYNARTPALR